MKRRRELSRPFEECQKIDAKIFRSKFSVKDGRVVCVEEHNQMMPTPKRWNNSTHLDLILNMIDERFETCGRNCGGDPCKKKIRLRHFAPSTTFGAACSNRDDARPLFWEPK